MAKTLVTRPTQVVIRSWPKMIFFWPVLVGSLLAAMLSYTTPPEWGKLWGACFTVLLGLNLMVLTFEFPRLTSLTLAFAIVALGLSVALINIYYPIIQPIQDFLVHRGITASAEFYMTIFLFLSILFVGMFCVTRFDYWELGANELVHHHGMLGDVERFSTAGLKFNKEITDVFEYILAGAGTITITLPSVPRPIVLNNVLFIPRVERLADRILDAEEVRLTSTAAVTDDANAAIYADNK